jgi:CRP/FNR family cyclic AMP-dependent transcriptional regulator
MEDLTRVIEAHPFLRGLDGAHHAVLVGCARNLRFEPGAFLLREGEAAKTFYLLRTGSVSLEVHVPGHDAVRVETAGAGDVLGLSWTGIDVTSPAQVPRVHLDCRAIDPVVAIALDGECLHRKMEADHHLGYALMKRLLALTYQRLERVRLQRLDVYKVSP